MFGIVDENKKFANICFTMSQTSTKITMEKTTNPPSTDNLNNFEKCGEIYIGIILFAHTICIAISIHGTASLLNPVTIFHPTLIAVTVCAMGNVVHVYKKSPYARGYVLAVLICFQWFAFVVFTSDLGVLMWGDKSQDCMNQNVSGDECSKLANFPMFICGAVYWVVMGLAVGLQTSHLHRSMKLKHVDGVCGGCFLIPE